MFDPVLLRASDLAASARFYRPLLEQLEIQPTSATADRLQWQDFALISAGERAPTRHLHIGFIAPTREHVDAFWRAGIQAGFQSDGEPGERPQYTPGYYGAFLIDPDGNSAEAVIHEDVRRGGHIDHLWIGIADLRATCAFYRLAARHTGLREGRHWEDGSRQVGRQFRGAWATFSLLADGRAPTEVLQLAFPAPDRLAVEQFFEAGVAAGYRTGGAPAERAQGGSPCYSASLLDPAGTTVESVFRGAPGESSP